MDWELWGTFSVGDHLRRRAFVSDVLLYDRLVVPVPPQSDMEEWKRWRKMGWRAARQRRLLDIIGRDKIVPVPWTESNRHNWESRYHEALDDQRAGAERSAVRCQMAQAASADVSRAIDAQKSFDWEGWKIRGGKPEEVDQLAHFTTRELLVDWSNMERDTELFMGLPPVQVDAVVAYGSYSAFTRDNRIESVDDKPEQADNLLNLFGWEFFVPNDTKRSDEDLLKEALELADLEETKQHRRAFHEWRRGAILANKSTREARQEMEDLIERYRKAVRKTRINTSAKYAFAIISVAAGAAAVALPPLGIASAFAALGSFAVSEAEKKGLPGKVKMAAMFHDARSHFGF